MKTVGEKIEAGDYTLPNLSAEELRSQTKEQRIARRIKRRALMDQFREDCLEETGLKGHPKAERIWELVQEYVGDDSLNIQYDVCSDLAEIAVGYQFVSLSS